MDLVLRQTNITLAIIKYIYVFFSNIQVLTKPCIQMASLKAFVIVIYSTSIVDNATVDCNVQRQQTGLPVIVNR